MVVDCSIQPIVTVCQRFFNCAISAVVAVFAGQVGDVVINCQRKGAKVDPDSLILVGQYDAKLRMIEVTPVDWAFDVYAWWRGIGIVAHCQNGAKPTEGIHVDATLDDAGGVDQARTTLPCDPNSTAATLCQPQCDNLGTARGTCGVQAKLGLAGFIEVMQAVLITQP